MKVKLALLDKAKKIFGGALLGDMWAELQIKEMAKHGGRLVL